MPAPEPGAAGVFGVPGSGAFRAGAHSAGVAGAAGAAGADAAEVDAEAGAVDVAAAAHAAGAAGACETETGRLAARVIAAAAARGLRVAVAESLTGGALAAALVSVPGASRVVSGGIVAYDTALKRSLLGVDPQLLAAEGPVAAEVARQMARGVRRACAVPRATGGLAETADPAGADADADVVFAAAEAHAAGADPAGADPARAGWAELGVATTGVAGPDPDPQTGQPAGTVWLGLSAGGAHGEEDTAIPLALGGDRSAIRAATVRAALSALLAAMGIPADSRAKSPTSRKPEST